MLWLGALGSHDRQRPQVLCLTPLAKILQVILQILYAPHPGTAGMHPHSILVMDPSWHDEIWMDNINRSSSLSFWLMEIFQHGIVDLRGLSFFTTYATLALSRLKYLIKRIVCSVMAYDQLLPLSSSALRRHQSIWMQVGYICTFFISLEVFPMFSWSIVSDDMFCEAGCQSDHG